MATAELLRRLFVIEISHLMDADKTLRLGGAARRLLGRARTLFAREDFMTVMLALEAAQPGEVT